MSDPIRIALFDAVGTVLAPNPGVVEVYQTLGAKHTKHNASFDVNELKLRIAAARVKYFKVGMPTSNVDLRSSNAIEFELWKRLVEDVFAELPSVDDLFDELWQHFALPKNWQVYKDVSPCWKSLQAAGVIIGLASNFDSRLVEICQSLPPFDTTDFVFCSAQIGFRKPSHEFYRQVESLIRKQMGLSFRTTVQIVMVGDDFQNDYASPSAFGWPSVWLNRNPSQDPIRPNANSDSLPSEISTLKQFHEFFNLASKLV